MSVPIFQKGETTTLKELKKILNATCDEELEPYMNTHFEFLGTHLPEQKSSQLTYEQLSDLNAEVCKTCKHKIFVASGGTKDNGERLRLFTLKNCKMLYAEIHIDANIDINKNGKDIVALAKIISSQVDTLMKG